MRPRTCCQLPKHLGIETEKAIGTEGKAENEIQAETKAMLRTETATKSETVAGAGDETETAFPACRNIVNHQLRVVSF